MSSLDMDRREGFPQWHIRSHSVHLAWLWFSRGIRAVSQRR